MEITQHRDHSTVVQNHRCKTSDCAWPSSWEEEDSHMSVLTLGNHLPSQLPGWSSMGSCCRTPHLFPAPNPEGPHAPELPRQAQGPQCQWRGPTAALAPEGQKNLPSQAVLALPFPAPPLLPNLLLTPKQGGCRFSGAGHHRLDCICLGINNLLLDGQSEFN